MKSIITGFHAIEEKIKRADAEQAKKMRIFVSKQGPRAKKIVEKAKEAGIFVENADKKTLDSLVLTLPESVRDHRGIVLELEIEQSKSKNATDFDRWLLESENAEKATVLILDEITDVHNIGAILRSCDQFGVDLALLPERKSIGNIFGNEVISRTSAGASESVPIATISNLVRAVKNLKDADFWIYGADAGGKPCQSVSFAKKSAIIMGSEGKGISRLLFEQCDEIASIPTCGTIDSLNVSVAAGILLYERRRQCLE